MNGDAPDACGGPVRKLIEEAVCVDMFKRQGCKSVCSKVEMDFERFAC